MLEAANRVALVSGASRGIGRKVVERLLASGFLVSAGLRDPSLLAPSERLHVQRYDAAVPASARDWVSACTARFGRLDALVNVAGVNTVFRIEDEDETALDQLWSINVKAPLRLIRAAMPHLRQAGNGRVVNVASLSGKRVRNANAGYAMSKFALVALTHAVRHAGWDDGVRATALCPGFVVTDMTMQVTKVPRSQMTDPTVLAELVEMLLLLPASASVAELLVNCQHEDSL